MSVFNSLFVYFLLLLSTFTYCIEPNFSSNNFLSFVEPEIKMQCSMSTLSNQFCIKYGDGVVNYYHCDKEKRKEYCGAINGEDFKCTPILNFHGESCTANTDCLTQNCVNKKTCEYKEKGIECASDKECSENFYCNTKKVCTEYITEENASCNENNKCSPKYICSSESKCVLKATIDKGKSANNPSLCKSFKLDSNGKCTNDYNLDDIDDYLASRRSLLYPLINWTAPIKLSDYEGPNLGDAETAFRAVDLYTKQNIKDIYGEEIYKCTYQIIKERMCTISGNYILSDQDMRNLTMVETEPPSLQDGLSGGAIAGIVIGCILGVALIAGIVYFFFFKKRLLSKNI